MTTRTLDSPFGPVSSAVEDGLLLRVRFQADTNSTENDDHHCGRSCTPARRLFHRALVQFRFTAGATTQRIPSRYSPVHDRYSFRRNANLRRIGQRFGQRLPSRRTGLRREPHSNHRPLSPGCCRRRKAWRILRRRRRADQAKATESRSRIRPVTIKIPLP